MRHILSLIVLVLLASIALAQDLEPSSVKVEVFLDRESPVLAVETYSFPVEIESNLQELSREIGSRYILWKRYVKGLAVHGCREKDATDIVLTLKKIDGVPTILLKYYCPSPEKVREDFFYETFLYNLFRFPVKGGLMELPEGYSLIVHLPPKALLISASPKPKETGGSVIWEGPLGTASPFSVTYEVPKVYTVPSLSERVSQYITDPYILFPLLALLVILYAARERIKERVAQWVSSLTEITKE